METKDQIFAAARAAFDRDGLEGLSLRDIARAVGITPMAIYRHYKDKQALVDALVLDALDEWSARAAAVSRDDPERWLALMGEAFLDFALQKPRRFEAAFLIHTKHARRYPDDFLAGRSPAGVMYLSLFERLRAQGRLSDTPPIEIMITIAGLSQGLVTLYRAGRIAGGEAEFRALFLRAMHRAIQSFLTETPS
ncbi:MAG TPA: TetR/AcrR family transcriptional regulator [Rhizomicrobium sp.]|nr:TetR/AcrR family transcriptional regulator [Rhizomicrobium sp.]